MYRMSVTLLTSVILGVLLALWPSRPAEARSDTQTAPEAEQRIRALEKEQATAQARIKQLEEELALAKAFNQVLMKRLEQTNQQLQAAFRMIDNAAAKVMELQKRLGAPIAKEDSPRKKPAEGKGE